MRNHLLPYGIRYSVAYRTLAYARGLVQWHKRKFAAPSPDLVKQSCLLRNGVANAPWIETGTYLGTTTRMLSKHSKMIYTVEPEPKLYSKAQQYFEHYINVKVISGKSEDVFPSLLPKINGDINFWLDGHYSAGITYRGSKVTPILDELACIGQHLSHFAKVTILIDDIRCFNPHLKEYAAYPSLDVLVDWARQYGLRWYVEHDIFVMRNH